MSVPTLAKSWSYDVNNVETYSGDTECAKKLILAFKNALVSAGWSVEASSDSVAVKNYGDASPDLWDDTSDLVFDSGDHSWVVVYSAALGVSVLVDCVYPVGGIYNHKADLYVVSGHVNADGATNSKPTAAGATYSETTDNSWAPASADSGTQAVWHAQWSADGKAFRFWARGNGTSKAGALQFLIQEPGGVPDNWGTPVVTDFYGDRGDTELQWNNSRYYNNSNLRALVSGAWEQVYISAEAFGSGDDPACRTASTTPTDLDSGGGYMILPMGVIGNAVGYRGSLGRMEDLWWAPLDMSTGDTVPDDGSRQFCAWAEWLLPWDGTNPVIA